MLRYRYMILRSLGFVLSSPLFFVYFGCNPGEEVGSYAVVGRLSGVSARREG